LLLYELRRARVQLWRDELAEIAAHLSVLVVRRQRQSLAGRLKVDRFDAGKPPGAIRFPRNFKCYFGARCDLLAACLKGC
jgi:hypothetical protein